MYSLKIFDDLGIEFVELGTCYGTFTTFIEKQCELFHVSKVFEKSHLKIVYSSWHKVYFLVSEKMCLRFYKKEFLLKHVAYKDSFIKTFGEKDEIISNVNVIIGCNKKIDFSFPMIDNRIEKSDFLLFKLKST